MDHRDRHGHDAAAVSTTARPGRGVPCHHQLQAESWPRAPDAPSQSLSGQGNLVQTGGKAQNRKQKLFTASAKV